MKKYLFILFVSSLFATSCSTMYKTASQKEVNPVLAAAVTSELEVSNNKILYTYTPTARVRRAGVENCIATAISEALATSGNYDVLIETQTAVLHRAFITRKVKSVTVTGYPAKYKNFQTVDNETLKESIANSTFPVSTTQKKSSSIIDRLF